MDAVRYAKFIPKGEAEKLIDKVAALGDSEAGALLKSNFVHIRTAKHSNEDIYSIIETAVLKVSDRSWIRRTTRS